MTKEWFICGKYVNGPKHKCFGPFTKATDAVEWNNRFKCLGESPELYSYESYNPFKLLNLRPLIVNYPITFLL
jgi:hypothetical protein